MGSLQEGNPTIWGFIFGVPYLQKPLNFRPGAPDDLPLIQALPIQDQRDRGLATRAGREGLRAQGSGLRAQGLGFRVQVLGFQGLRAWFSGFRLGIL